MSRQADRSRNENGATRRAWRLCLAAAWLAAAGRVCAQTVQERLNRAEAHWSAREIQQAVVEWQAVLELEPGNTAARNALDRVGPAFAASGHLLDVAGRLIREGLHAEAREALDRWTPALATPDQQAQMSLLRGHIALGEGAAENALASFEAAAAAAEREDLRLRARIGKARALAAHPERLAEASALLREIAAATDAPALRADARWWLLALVEQPGRDRLAAMRAYIGEFPASEYRSEAWREVAALLDGENGGPTRESLQAGLAAWTAAAFAPQRAHAALALREAIGRLTAADVLTWLAGELVKLPADWQTVHPPRELAAIGWERLAATGEREAALGACRSLRDEAAALLKTDPGAERRLRWQSYQARGHLMEGQLLLMAGQEAAAIESLHLAADAYKHNLRAGDAGAREPILRIGLLLEGRGRADAAARHYETAAAEFADDPLGADGLWQAALLYRDRLDQPARAVALLKRYQDLYPPEFRVPTSAQERIRKLGYKDVAGFQAAHGLKPDGDIGSNTLAALEAEERQFQEILPAASNTAQVVKGRMIHDALMDMARDLEARGRFRDAIQVGQAFVGMYPGHSLADDALLGIARILRRNDLFREAAAAYERLLADYPNGDQTSHAYLECANCRECLGEWREAERLCDLYVKKFPKYSRAADATARRAALGKLIRYADLVGEKGVADAKLADALYEMGRLLYKEMGNRQKAVELFQQVADRFPASYHAADARFSAGACLLHEGNFEEARTAFRRLVTDHADSRLADDGQYWLGHTFEYQARALGELDARRIVVDTRSAAEGQRLRADVALRRQFWAGADGAAAAWHQPHPDLLAAGRTHDRVRADLFAAVEAYRLVVERHPLGDMAQKALLRVGAIYTEYLKDADKAIEAYRQLLEKYPGSPEAVDAQFAVGRHYMEQGALDKAERAITLFLTSFPNHEKSSDALLDLAECHRLRKEWIKALDDYQSYLNRFPASPRADEVRQEVEWIKRYRF